MVLNNQGKAGLFAIVLIGAGLFALVASGAPGAPGETGQPGAAMDGVDIPTRTEAASDWDLEIRVFSWGYADAETGLPVSIVPAGTTVRWVWDHGDLPTPAIPHSVTSGVSSLLGHDGLFDSDLREDQDEPENGGDLPPFTVTFGEPGEYLYYCKTPSPAAGIPHEIIAAQRGLIIVE